MTLILVVIGVVALTVMFYLGAKLERAKNIEKENLTIRNAYRISNSSISDDELQEYRKKYKRSSV